MNKEDIAQTKIHVKKPIIKFDLEIKTALLGHSQQKFARGFRIRLGKSLDLVTQRIASRNTETDIEVFNFASDCLEFRCCRNGSDSTWCNGRR